MRSFFFYAMCLADVRVCVPLFLGGKGWGWGYLFWFLCISELYYVHEIAAMSIWLCLSRVMMFGHFSYTSSSLLVASGPHLGLYNGILWAKLTHISTGFLYRVGLRTDGDFPFPTSALLLPAPCPDCGLSFDVCFGAKLTPLRPTHFEA